MEAEAQGDAKLQATSLEEAASGDGGARRAGRRLALILAVVSAGAVAWWLTRSAFDDAYISYRYAEQLLEGHGLVYNPGQRVEGYSNFLWVLIAAAGMTVGLDPFSWTRALGVAAYLGSLALIAARFDAWGLEKDAGPAGGGSVGAIAFAWGSPLLLAALVLPRGYAGQAGAGLETSFVSLLLVALGLFGLARPPARRAARWASTSLPALACLTRLDAALAVAAWAVVCFARESRRAGAGAAARRLVVSLAPTAVCVALYFSWKLAYYGALLPNTYYAKGADSLQLEAGLAYLWAFLRSDPQVLPLTLLALLGALFARSAHARAFARYGLLAVALHLAYVVKVGGDFMQYRFVWQIYPLWVAAAIPGLAVAGRRSPALALLLVAASVLGATRPVVLEARFGMQSLDTMNRYTELGREVGPALSRALPEGTRIATTLAGTMAYGSQLEVVDQWGLNEAYVRVLPSPERFQRGHLKMMPYRLMVAREIGLYVEHPRICSCAKPCLEKVPNVFLRLGGDRCLRTTYLQPTPALTRHFCAHPERFLLHAVNCAGFGGPVTRDRPQGGNSSSISPEGEKTPRQYSRAGVPPWTTTATRDMASPPSISP